MRRLTRVFAGVMFRGFFGVVLCVEVMPVGDVRVMSGRVGVTGFVLFGGGQMVLRRMLVMRRCVTMVFRALVLCHPQVRETFRTSSGAPIAFSNYFSY